MPIELSKKNGGEVLLRIEGKVSTRDYSRCMPEIERIGEGEKRDVHMRVEMGQFEGWETTSSWKDMVREEPPPVRNVRKIAFVGGREWRNWMWGFCRPFKNAEIRFFGEQERDRAMRWLAA